MTTATKERDFTEPTPIVELARTGDIATGKKGRSIVVAVKDAGNGPAIDLREYIGARAYGDNDGRIRAGDSARGRKSFTPYVGFTRVGWWLSVDAAEALYLALGDAITAAVSTEGADR